MKRLLTPSVFILIIICFLLPFVTVSCGNQPGPKLTAMNFVTGTSLGSDKIDPNPLAIAAFAAAIAGLVLNLGFWQNKKRFLISGVLSGIGFAAILALKFIVDAKLQEEGGGMLRADWEIGFYMLLIMYLVAIGVCIVSAKDGPLPPISAPALPDFSGFKNTGHKFCPQCGVKNEAANGFCKECGAKF